jgi:hypothetical protein
MFLISLSFSVTNNDSLVANAFDFSARQEQLLPWQNEIYYPSDILEYLIVREERHIPAIWYLLLQGERAPLKSNSTRFDSFVRFGKVSGVGVKL